MTKEEETQKRSGGPGTEYEDTDAHERIGFRQNDQTEIGSDTLNYNTANNTQDPSTKK